MPRVKKQLKIEREEGLKRGGQTDLTFNHGSMMIDAERKKKRERREGSVCIMHYSQSTAMNAKTSMNIIPFFIF